MIEDMYIDIAILLSFRKLKYTEHFEGFFLFYRSIDRAKRKKNVGCKKSINFVFDGVFAESPLFSQNISRLSSRLYLYMY
jgi:hypothetical protein